MKRYRVIVVDPPWDYGDKRLGHGDGTGNLLKKSVTRHYKTTMTVDEIKEFKLVREIADEDCICFLWTTDKFWVECPEILYRWGFDLKAGGRLMTWHKYGAGLQVIGGWNQNAEHVIVGACGNARRKWKDTIGLKACFGANKTGHSVKPAEFYKMVRNATFGPRIDIFARGRHIGFDAWGDQVEEYPRDDIFAKDFPETRITKLGTGLLHEDIEKV